MSYPNQSSFQSAEAGALWWGAQYGSQQHVCSTQGRTLIKLAQRQLGILLPLAFTIDTPGFGSNYGPYLRSSIAVDGAVGVHTLAGVIREVDDLDAPAAIKQAIRADFDAYAGADARSAGSARGMPLSQATCACLIWIGTQQTLPWSSFTWPGSMIPPLWDTAPPDDSGVAPTVVCAIPLPGGTVAPPTISVNAAGAHTSATTTTGNAPQNPAGPLVPTGGTILGIPRNVFPWVAGGVALAAVAAMGGKRRRYSRR